MDYSNGNKLNQQGSNLENQGQNFSNIPPQNSIRNLKIIIGVLVVLLVGALGVAGYYIFGNKNISQTEQPTPTQATNAPKSNPTPTPPTKSQNTSNSESFVVPQNAVIANQKTVAWNGKNYTITQYCQGTVQNQKIEVNITYSGQMSAPFCIGNNILVLGYNGIQVKIDETKVDSNDKALALDFPLDNGKSFITKNGELLLKYSVDSCLTAGNCGIGQPIIVNLDISLNNGSARKLNNFPESWEGEPIWNSSQTRAVFLPRTGGAGCTMGPITGYDLQKDRVISTIQSACGVPKGTDVVGNPKNSWSNLQWNNDLQASATISFPNGKTQVVTLDFK
jgi:hypothetical protein